MEYNTQRPQLKISDYGRNISKLIDYAKTIESRDRRNQMAAAIVDIMSRIDGWERTGERQTIKGYGQQRPFTRISAEDKTK